MKYIAFDFDGTLADTKFAICDAMERSCIRNGTIYIGDEEFSQHIGIRLEEQVQYATKEKLDQNKIDSIVESYRQTYRNNLVTLFPGIKEIIQNCLEDGNQLAITSSRHTDSLNELLEQLQIKELFNIVIGGDQVLKPKPHPEILWRAATEFQCNPAEVVLVGDTTWDIETAKSTGAYAVGVTWGTHDEIQLRGSGADHICNTIEELQQYFELLAV